MEQTYEIWSYCGEENVIIMEEEDIVIIITFVIDLSWPIISHRDNYSENAQRGGGAPRGSNPGGPGPWTKP